MNHRHRIGVILTGVLVLIACIRFEYNTPTSRLVVPGLAGSSVVLWIVAGVLIFTLLRAVRRLCVSHLVLPREIPCWYYALIPVAAVGVAVKGHWHGPLTTDLFGNPAHRWEILWSDSNWDVAFLAALIGVVLLFRVFQLLAAVARALPARTA